MDRNKENILNQLKKSGPGFTVPKAYFKEAGTHDNSDNYLENNTSEKITGSNLDIHLKAPGFKVPNGYFETVESNIFESRNPKIISFKTKVVRVLTFAAAASVLLFFGINYMNSNQGINEEMVFEDEELVSWIESDLVDFNSYELAEAFNDLEFEHDLYAEEDIDEYLNTVDIENLILENR